MESKNLVLPGNPRYQPKAMQEFFGYDNLYRGLARVEIATLETLTEFGKVLDTLISEHQRDLVGSSVARDFPIILINLQHQLDTMLRQNKAGVPFLSRITVNQEDCQRNFTQSSHLVLAEPLYIALQMAGYRGDAHELVNSKLVPIATKKKALLVEVLEDLSEDDPDLGDIVGNISHEIWDLLHNPEQYTGKAESKAIEVADYAEVVLGQLTQD